MAVQQDRRAALKRLKLLVYAPKLNIDSFRSKIEETFACSVLPNHVDCTDYNYGGVSCDVLSPEIYSSRRIVIYIHGGSFVAGSRASWRGFCARLAAKSFSRVVVPEFRLAPAHPYPAAFEDVQAVFRTVYTELQVACSLDASAEKAAAHPEIIIASDGSGASIACALLFSLREKYRAGVSRLVFFSPWLDFSEEAAAAKGKKASDELINGETLLRCGEIYTFVSNLTNPLVSPLYAAKEQLSDFPPVYIQCGEKELLLGDIERFSELLASNGSQCELDVWPKMMPFFQFADDYLWETHLAIGKAGSVISGEGDTDAGTSFHNKPRLENSLQSDA